MKWFQNLLFDSYFFIFSTPDYFGYITEMHETLTCNPPVRIYIDKIENKITCKIKSECHLELLTPEMMKLLGST